MRRYFALLVVPGLGSCGQPSAGNLAASPIIASPVSVWLATSSNF
jgi:hypothetical protein